jgi:hypothetical protein
MYSTAQGSIRGATMRSSLPSLPSVDLRSSTDQLPWMDLRASMDAGVMRSSMDMRSPMDTVRRPISLARFRPLFLTACTDTQSRVDAMFALTSLFVSQSLFLSRSMESRSMTPRNFQPEPPAPIFHPDLSEPMRHQLQKHAETKSIAGFGSQRLQVLRLRVRAFCDVSAANTLGTVHWARPTPRRAGNYPASCDTRMTLVAGTYLTRPPRGGFTASEG